MIRPAVAEDMEQVCGYWNPLIRDTTVTFSTEEKCPAALWQMIGERRAAGAEFFVAEDGGAILGHASYGRFRSGNGYDRVMEHTIILAPGAWGRGLGRGLMAALEAQARGAGIAALIGGVSAENAAGIGFHTAIGYPEVARVPAVGWKFGRWIDLVLMMKRF